jgi:hypothetical protein
LKHEVSRRDGSSWHCAQIHYYDGDRTDDLILDCVRPLLQALAPDIERGFFLRHWLRGPHLRVCLSAPEATFREVLRPRLEAIVGSHLAGHPSKVAIDETSLLAAHRQLAAREQEEGPLAPLEPDNSIRYRPHDRRLRVLQSEAAACLLEDFYCETTPLVFDMLDHVRAGGRSARLTLALDLMLATAHTQWPDIRRGFISFRSHAEGFIVQAADPAARRAQCQETYRSQADRLGKRLGAILDGLDQHREGVPFVGSWVACLARFRAAADALIAAGEVSFAAADPREGDARWDPSLLQHSRFHQLLQDNGARLAFMREDPGFLGFRLMLNYLYLHLNRLGVRPFERGLLCHLAAATVEDRFGISAEDFVAA